MTTFTVYHDADYGFIVADAAISARSFAMVPIDFAWSFATKAEASGMARAISSHDRVATRMFDTPDRFEEVADTRYGCAW